MAMRHQRDSMWFMDPGIKIPRLTWWWWFWLLYIDNKDDPLHPKQFMILWSTKNCKNILVDQMPWQRKKGLKKTQSGLEFDGMAAAWYFDGKKMTDEFILERDEYAVLDYGDDSESGALFSVTKKKDGCRFEGNKKEYKLFIKKPGIDFDFTMTPCVSGPLSQHDYSERMFRKKYGYNIMKIRKMDLAGTMRTEPGEGGTGEKEHITGTAYFQKVTVNSPAVPWYWSAIHFGDGSYLQYSAFHAGLPMLMRGLEPHRTFEARGRIYLSNKVEFYCAKEDKTYEMKNIWIGKKHNPASSHLPTFSVGAKNKKEEEEIYVECEAYAHAYWRFEQPFPLKNTILYYNEYPSIVKQFYHKNKERVIRLDSMDGGYGNCEHSWGFLV